MSSLTTISMLTATILTQLDPEAQAKMLDRQLGFGTALGDWEIEMEDESQFSISKGRNKTVSTVVHEDEASLNLVVAQN